MGNAEETPTAAAPDIPEFDVWRDETEPSRWRGRHRESGRTVSADTWELLLWRAYEVRILISITNISDMLSGGRAGS